MWMLRCLKATPPQLCEPPAACSGAWQAMLTMVMTWSPLKKRLLMKQFFLTSCEAGHGDLTTVIFAVVAVLLACQQRMDRGLVRTPAQPFPAPQQASSVHVLRHSLVMLETMLSRARHEWSRSRTKERALLALQQLAALTSAHSPGMPARARLTWLFGVALPSHSHLRCEAGASSLGLARRSMRRQYQRCPEFRVQGETGPAGASCRRCRYLHRGGVTWGA